MKAKCARRRGESTVLFKNEHAAQANARWHIRSGHAGLGRRTTNIVFVFIGECKNVHRVQARAHFSKCTPRASESSILPTQVVFMTSQVSKMSTALRREHHSQSKGAPRAGELPKSAPTERRRCSRCSGAHSTNLSLDLPDVRNAWQGAAE